MERSRRSGTNADTATPAGDPPASSRLNVRRKNRRKPASLWSRVASRRPSRREIVDACGRALRRSLPALAATCAIGIVCGALWLGYRFVTTSPRFAITEIQVAGNARLSADEIRDAMPIAIGDNIFAADLASLGDALRTHPWIASAEVKRILPHTLTVEIREHEPAGLVALGELYLVDNHGRPFKRADLAAGDGEDLPIVTGLARDAYRKDPGDTADAIARALGVAAAWRAEAERPAIGEVYVDAHHALTLRTYDHAIAIQLGQGGPTPELADRMRLFDAAWAELGEQERLRARAIHLDTRVTISFAN
jgi:cell division protein FtsQ